MYVLSESTTTRIAGGLKLSGVGQRKKYVSALNVAVGTGCEAPGLKTANKETKGTRASKCQDERPEAFANSSC